MQSFSLFRLLVQLLNFGLILFDAIKNWRIRGPNNTKKQLRLLQIPFGGQRLADTCTMPMFCAMRFLFNSVSARRVFGHCYSCIIFDFDVLGFSAKKYCMHIWCMRASVICNVRVSCCRRRSKSEIIWSEFIKPSRQLQTHAQHMRWISIECPLNPIHPRLYLCDDAARHRLYIFDFTSNSNR